MIKIKKNKIMVEGHTRIIRKFALLPTLLNDDGIVWLIHYNALQECKVVTKYEDLGYPDEGREYQALDWVTIGKSL